MCNDDSCSLFLCNLLIDHAHNKEMTILSLFRQLSVWHVVNGFLVCSADQVEMDSSKQTNTCLVHKTKNMTSLIW